MKKYKYCFTITVSTCIALILVIMGMISLMKGIKNGYQASRVKSSYCEENLKKGAYFAKEIRKEDLLGRFYFEMNGKRAYSAICCTEAIKGEQSYLIKVNDSQPYYVTLLVPRSDTRYFEAIVRETSEKYHMTGKVEYYKEALYYDSIAEVTGITDKGKIHKLISPKYAIRIVDIEKKSPPLWQNFS